LIRINQTTAGLRQSRFSRGPVDATEFGRVFDRLGDSPPFQLRWRRSLPPLHWRAVPPTTRSLALLCDDPDASGGKWHHWTARDIAADQAGVAEGAGDSSGATGFRQAINDFHRAGYGGPCRPGGMDRIVLHDPYEAFQMTTPRTLVVFYSRSGTTRGVAQALAGTLRCDLEEIAEPRSRSGFFGYMRSLLEARRKLPSVIAPKKHDVSSYDLVVVGTPVWGWSLSSPVRAYLMATAGQLPEVAFFCTLGGKGSESAFAQMTAIAGKKPRAVCAITQREALSAGHVERLAAFAKALTVTIH
jgi:flavodoxin